MALHAFQNDRHRADQIPAWQIPAQARGVLNALRMIAMECRTHGRAELFEACALISNQSCVAQDAHARALVRCLRQALGVRPTFYRPGEVDVSFDEAWLIRAVQCSRAKDWPSFEFLIRSRVAPQHLRNLAFLIHGISDRFGKL
ncbi:hypothetical protein [Algirhabdus cladophorae]|uniref:hypothetical protein n=1 Tax=Algirhabdus cladophorae TaxID=3377108 RepID=UPI003B84A05A